MSEEIITHTKKTDAVLNFVKTRKGIACIAAALVLLIALGTGIWWLQAVKFQNVTVELGTSPVSLEQFLNGKAVAGWAGFVTDVGSIDYSKPGTQPVILTHMGRQEQVYLTIQDTTAPQVSFQDVTVGIGQPVTPDMFIKDYADLDNVTLSFAVPLEQPAHYTDRDVTVVVTDASGNETSQNCKLSYEWLKESYTHEFGLLLQPQDLLLDPAHGSDLIDTVQLDAINNMGVGEYTLVSSDGGKVFSCSVLVQDTTAPTLTVQEVAAYRGRKLKLEHFLVSATDLSGEVDVRMVTEPDTSEFGVKTVVIEATDIYGNTAIAEAKLRVVSDTVPPRINGLKKISIEKNGTPDYVKGVRASDNRDGQIEFTYDASRVDTSKAGVYYVTYTAMDEAGNVTTTRRTVEVAHDASDTDALVAQHAAKCGNTVESIRNYVRTLIKYNHNWGGDDPVWYGLTNKVGNCYVHALVLQRLLTLKGFECKLIWVTNKTHYWLVVNMGGYWRHVDATPTTKHSIYVFMTDEQRYETLSGRNWKRSDWPACE